MSRITYIAVILLLLAGTAWPQQEAPDTEPGAADAADAEVVAEADEDETEEVDDSDLDVQTYEESEDDFVPTEEIPTDEPIPFPSNI